MIWYGQYNAILILILLAGIIVSFMVEEPGFAIITFALVIFLRICVGFINLLFKAFVGRPLVYNTKIMHTKTGGGVD
ncbi:MAG: hypothetical protein VR70_12705 [Rhodospirillaceae bacterium BRH_c57]|nr:MAG: hypothetical protein VR70_12705 [Rhodospirillaceae bacterium BRH_c57]